MKPPVFDYIAPENLDHALHELQQAGWDAKLLAGGQSLVPMMNFRLVQPAVLIDLNPLEELSFIRSNGDGAVRIGAMTRLSRLEQDPLIEKHIPLLHEALPHVAHIQIRTRGTAGGSLAHADPAAELPVIALAADARMKLKGPDGERWLDAPDFFQGMFTTALGTDEILVELEIPPTPESTGWAFIEFARRPGDYALCGVAARITLDDAGVCSNARLVYLNAGDGPVTAFQAAASLVGQPYSKENAAEAARIAAETEIAPMGNVHASPEYQQHLAAVLTRRVLETAFHRAGQD
ncbi:MAG: xanthine dehydrogenase family protein subunit M [Anaerolineales bacterium]|nr:xanthine dehydrogenase family protein subunit M [Anaerolineales bacterium]